ncbi:sulfotransferase [Methylotetracoccus oryzae]|uniref:sulfotransferase n=1 Tax=Methylotetracoccus oryzae TaxID=1919059 RepID=UPI001118FA06|nr:sulfotransferase [Methylotetracoccus oryzae]
MSAQPVNTGLPHFLCIGAQKAGTSWLWSMLRQNPAIWMPPIKELHFFDHVFLPENRGWIEKGLAQQVKKLLAAECREAEGIDLECVRYLVTVGTEAPFTEHWYRGVFSHPDANEKILGEVTPAYCAIGAAGVAYLKQLLGRVKAIYLIRDPVDRALSQIRMTIQRSKTFDAAEPKAWERVANSTAVHNRGNYAEYIPLWVDGLGKENVLFLPFGDIVRRPLALLRDVEKFLGCEEMRHYSGVNSKVHKTGNIEIPSSVVERIEDTMKVQRQFLESYFGRDFVASTK